MGSPFHLAAKLLGTQQNRVPLLFIGGIGVESEGQATIQVCSPADGQPIGRCPAGNGKDVDRAVRTARQAFDDTWKDTPPEERANILWRAAGRIERDARELAVLESLQTGKTYREALTTDVAVASAALKYYAGWVNKTGGRVRDLGGGFSGYTHRVPYPVSGAILSWQTPLASAALQAAQALAVGSTLVLKPSERSPMTALRLAEVLHDSGLPGGAFNVVTGMGAPAGEALARHPEVQALTFSGSIETARHVLVSSAKSNLKKMSMMLGGKCSNILFEDCSVESAIQAAWKSSFTARGQLSTAGSRLLCHNSIYDDVVRVITERTRELIVGDPLDEHTDIGPVISEEQLKRILAYVGVGRKEGARLVAGGSRDVDGQKASGYFVKPTVFINVNPNMRIAKEEILGPVLTITGFDSEEEAIEIANGTEYGMANAIWTRDFGRVRRVSEHLEAGVVWVNHYHHQDPSLPFGGIKLSGHGRDFGEEGLDKYSYAKSIYVPSR